MYMWRVCDTCMVCAGCVACVHLCGVACVACAYHVERRGPPKRPEGLSRDCLWLCPARPRLPDSSCSEPPRSASGLQRLCGQGVRATARGGSSRRPLWSRTEKSEGKQCRSSFSMLKYSEFIFKAQQSQTSLQLLSSVPMQSILARAWERQGGPRHRAFTS